MKYKDFCLFSSLFEYKLIEDADENQYVVFVNSQINSIETPIDDKTEFEAVENHIHLLNKICPKNMEEIYNCSKNLAQAVLNSLNNKFPHKKFVVYITGCVKGDLTLRFHQKWENEPYYFDYQPTSYTDEEWIIMAEN